MIGSKRRLAMRNLASGQHASSTLRQTGTSTPLADSRESLSGNPMIFETTCSKKSYFPLLLILANMIAEAVTILSQKIRDRLKAALTMSRKQRTTKRSSIS